MLAMVEKLKVFFVGRKDVKFAVMYGSAATNRLTDYSDVDIAIASDKEFEIEQLEEISQALEEVCGRGIDLVDISSAGSTLVQEILSEGIILLNDTEIFGRLTKLMWYDESVIGHEARSCSKPKRRRSEYD